MKLRLWKTGHQAREDKQWSLGAETWKKQARRCSCPSLLFTQTAKWQVWLPRIRSGTQRQASWAACSRPERRGREGGERTLHENLSPESAGATAETCHSGDIIYSTKGICLKPTDQPLQDLMIKVFQVNKITKRKKNLKIHLYLAAGKRRMRNIQNH